MDAEEIRSRLETWMPGDPEPSDPAVRAALAAARADPELHAWLEQRVRFDQRVVDAVAAVPVSPQFQAALVANMTRARHQHRRRYALRSLAIAASVLVLLGCAGGGWWIWGNSSELQGREFAAFAEETLRYSRRIPRLQFRDRELADVRGWLEAAGQQVPESLPDWLTRWPAKGCRVLEFDGRDVVLICFRGDRTYHLYLLPRPVPGADALPAAPAVRRSGDWSEAVWADAAFVYVVNVPGPLVIEPETVVEGELPEMAGAG